MERKDGVIIVGSGQSAKGFEAPDDVTVIAVNGAIEWLNRADYFFTLDPSRENLLRIERYHNKAKCVVALPHAHDTYGLKRYNVSIMRRVSRKNNDLINDGSPQYWLDRWGGVKGLSDIPNAIHSGNSAYGALGLAYHLGFKKALLIGIDADSSPRLEGGIPNNLSHLPLLFQSARNQIEIRSCGKMGGVHKVSLSDGLKWVGSNITSIDEPISIENVESVVKRQNPEKTTVALVLKSGGDYDEEYVHRLIHGIKSNVTLPIDIAVLTDVKHMKLTQDVNVLPLNRNFEGWWSKLELFDYFTQNKTVYFDLDTIIKGNIDWLINFDTPFACLTDLLHPEFIATGVMAWNGDYSYLPESFDMTMDNRHRQTGNWGDQGYISQKLKISPQRIQSFFPKQIASYKSHNLNEKQNASVICYHGKPRPHETGWAI